MLTFAACVKEAESIVSPNGGEKKTLAIIYHPNLGTPADAAFEHVPVTYLTGASESEIKNALSESISPKNDDQIVPIGEVDAWTGFSIYPFADFENFV